MSGRGYSFCLVVCSKCFVTARCDIPHNFIARITYLIYFFISFLFPSSSSFSSFTAHYTFSRFFFRKELTKNEKNLFLMQEAILKVQCVTSIQFSIILILSVQFTTSLVMSRKGDSISNNHLLKKFTITHCVLSS